MPPDPHRRESFFHAALVQLGILGLASQSADRKTAELLQEHRSFEAIYLHCWKNPTPALQERSQKKKKSLEQLVQKLEKLPFSFQTITCVETGYPASLRALDPPPPVLYLHGNPELLLPKSLAVVGTRELYLDSDKEKGTHFVEQKVTEGYAIVSGLARGCDTLAHVTAMSQAGKTIAVLGTPLDRYYPPENKTIQEAIGQQHLLVSPYPIGASTFGSFFAHRNRITVGLSAGVAIILAGDKSGTQHAIKACLQQQKPLYVLDNNLNRGFKWVNELRGSYTIIGGP